MTFSGVPHIEIIIVPSRSGVRQISGNVRFSSNINFRIKGIRDRIRTRGGRRTYFTSIYLSALYDPVEFPPPHTHQPPPKKKKAKKIKSVRSVRISNGYRDVLSFSKRELLPRRRWPSGRFGYRSWALEVNYGFWGWEDSS